MATKKQQSSNDKTPIDEQDYGLHRLFSDPLFHFLLIAVLMFAVESFYLSDSVNAEVADITRADDNKAIYVDEYLRADLQQTFKNQTGRIPSENEMETLIDQWLKDELVFREGIAMGVHHNDVVVRDRVVDKTKTLLAKLGAKGHPTDEQLREWFRKKSDDYRRPSLYSFDYISSMDLGFESQRTDLRSVTESLAKKMNAGANDASEQIKNYGVEVNKVIKRNAYGVVAEFGRGFDTVLNQHALDEWFAVESYNEWLLVRIVDKQVAPLPDFKEVRELVERDWQRHQQRIHLHSVIERLKSKYPVQSEAS